MKKVLFCLLVFFLSLSSSCADENAFWVYSTAVDLNNDGLETIELNRKQIYFDVDNDGFRELTGWVSGKDAILTIDRNNNGKIDNQLEIFGSLTSQGDIELSLLDSNNDKVINMDDKAFSQIRLWRDANENGVTDNNELKSLSDVGIVSINIGLQPLNIENNKNFITGKSFVIYKNGKTRNLYYVKNSYSINNTIVAGDYSISANVIDLPWLRGYGRTYDLQYSATRNEDLRLFIKKLASSDSANEIYNNFDKLISMWICDNKTGVDMQKLCLKKIMRENAPDLEQIKPKNLQKAYEILKNILYVNFIAQTHFGQKFDIKYDYPEDKIVPGDKVYERIIENMTVTDSYLASYIILERLRRDNSLDTKRFADAISQAGYGAHLITYYNSGASFRDFKNYVSDGKTPLHIEGLRKNDHINGANTPDIIYGNNGNDLIKGGAGDDFLHGGKGDDKIYGEDGSDILIGAEGYNTLEGGGGNDIYIYNGLGTDKILDEKWGQLKVQRWCWDSKISDYRSTWEDKGKIFVDGGDDTVILGGRLSKDKIVAKRKGDNLVFNVKDSTNSLIIINWYASQEQRVENFKFKDGTTLDTELFFEIEKGNDFITFINKIVYKFREFFV